MTNHELLKRLQVLEAAERDVASSMDLPQEQTANWEYAETAAIARSAILQQQEGLANYAQENERLRTALTKAHAELDDILEDWQLEGRHGQPRYEQLKRETKAAEDAIRHQPQSAEHSAEQQK